MVPGSPRHAPAACHCVATLAPIALLGAHAHGRRCCTRGDCWIIASQREWRPHHLMARRSSPQTALIQHPTLLSDFKGRYLEAFLYLTASEVAGSRAGGAVWGRQNINSEAGGAVLPAGLRCSAAGRPRCGPVRPALAQAPGCPCGPGVPCHLPPPLAPSCDAPVVSHSRPMTALDQ